MAYPNSLLLIAVFLVATTSVANCLITASALVTGVAQTSKNNLTEILSGVNVTFACNQTPVAPPVTTSFGSGYFAIVGNSNAPLTPTQCALFTNATVGGVSAQLIARIIPLTLIPTGFTSPVPTPVSVFTSSFFNVIAGA